MEHESTRQDRHREGMIVELGTETMKSFVKILKKIETGEIKINTAINGLENAITSLSQLK